MNPYQQFLRFLLAASPISIIFAVNIGLLVEDRYSHLLPLPANKTTNDSAFPETITIGGCHVLVEIFHGNNQSEIYNQVSFLKEHNSTLIVTYTTCEMQELLRFYLKLYNMSHVWLPDLFCESFIPQKGLSPFKLLSQNNQLINAILEVVTSLEWKKVAVFLNGFLNKEQELSLLSGLTDREIFFVLHRLRYGEDLSYSRSMQAYKRHVLPLQFLLVIDAESAIKLLQFANQTGIIRKNIRWIIGNLNTGIDKIRDLQFDPYNINIITFKTNRYTAETNGCGNPEMQIKPAVFPNSPALEDAFQRILFCKSWKERLTMLCSNNIQDTSKNNSARTNQSTTEDGEIITEQSYFVVGVQYDLRKEQELVFKEIAEWTYSKPFKFYTRIPFPNFQPGLGNITLKVGYNPLKPFLTKETEGNNTEFVGLCVEILIQLSRSLNFQYELIATKDSTFGSENKTTHIWSGLIGMAARADVNLAIGPLTLTYNRFSVVDYTQPYMPDGISILIKRPSKHIANILQSFKVFTWMTWGALIASFIVTVITLTVINRLYFSAITNTNNCPKQIQSYGHNLWFILGYSLKEGKGIEPVNISGRVIVGSWWLFIILISTSYTAHLVAFLTIPHKHNEIRSLKELATQSVLKPIAFFGSDKYEYFQNVSNEDYKRIGDIMASGPVVTKEKEMLILVDNHDYAFISDESLIYYIAGKFCGKYYVVRGDTPRQGLGFVTPKHSPYLAAISSTLMLIQQSGLIERYQKQWWPSDDECLKEEKSNNLKAKKIGLGDLGGIFIVCGCLAVFGVVCAIFETVLSRFKKKPKNTFSSNWRDMTFYLSHKFHMKPTNHQRTWDLKYKNN
ncbi:glutamate receptor ionotropic, delta-1-like [Octopus sinensis]|uniref:Glutamate receptor ionotropic, delta-1-like n=1 Tax=Octopus sinensis TaxID=2607531 RepID=A0A7E6FPZ7_9MOLL|nr:glutamate receptor ionotropic, delta-1-like [Octopus sinensis]